MPPKRRRSDRGEDRPDLALDPTAMRDVLRRALGPAPGQRWEIRGCRGGPLRRREGYRYAVTYELLLHEPTTGESRDQVVTGVVSGPGRTRRLWETLRGGADPPSAADPTPFVPFAHVPDLDMLLQVFPHDHRLPALAPLLAGPPPGMEQALLAGFDPGGWRLVGREATSVRYRVDTRATVRLAVRAREGIDGREEMRTFHAKLLREEADARRVDDILRSLRDGVAAAGARFAVAVPVAFDPERRTVVQSGLPGVPLLRLLRRDRDAVSAVGAAARALAAFPRLDLGPDREPAAGQAPARSLAEKLGRLERAAESLRAARPDLATEVDETAPAVAAGLAGVPPGPTHGDLKPDHFLVEGSEIGLIDFDMLLASDPIQDVATMVEHLARIGGSAPRVFVDAYFAAAPEGGRARLPLYHALNLLVRAARAERGRAADAARARIEEAIRTARAALSGEGWTTG